MQTEGLGGQQLKINQPKVLLGILFLYKVGRTAPRTAPPPLAAAAMGVLKGGNGWFPNPTELRGCRPILRAYSCPSYL